MIINNRKHKLYTCDYCGKQSYKRADSKGKSCGCLRILKAKQKALPFGVAAFNNLYLCYKNNAKVKNRVFELTKDEFRLLTINKCYFCSSPPNAKHKTNKGMGYYIYNGIDRINNDIGYTLSNCVSCCKICNMSKRQLSYNEFVSWIELVYNNIKDLK